MLFKTYGYAVNGIDAIKIIVETNITQGINFFMVGLPDSAVKESQQRIQAALKNIDYRMPGKQITINMAPADIRKEGSAYDLTIAIGILAASEQIKISAADDSVIMGELALNGTVRPIKGALPIAIKSKKDGFRKLFLPAENAHESAIVEGIEVYPIENIKQLIDYFNGEQNIEPLRINIQDLFLQKLNEYDLDFADVKGQQNIKRSLEIAAAGGHNVILIGPPGAGKTMLSKRLPSILPPLTLEEALETTKIHSVAGKVGKNIGLITQRPFRSPHHTISDVALVGGGNNPQPGEISLAHNGVLFLDELPEFKRSVLEVLRQPLEDRVVTISRAKFSVQYPASFMLVASMNPCPCGYYNHPEKECVCTPSMVQKYLSKISGPLMDRIDLHVEVVPVNFEELSSRHIPSENSKHIRERVMKARNIQTQRFKNKEGIYCNAQMRSNEIKEYCQLDDTGTKILKTAMEKLQLSARAYDRILKVARTIADLDNSENILAAHVAEAVHYRSLDRQNCQTSKWNLPFLSALFFFFIFIFILTISKVKFTP